MLKKKGRVKPASRVHLPGKTGQPAKIESQRKFKIKDRAVYELVMKEVDSLMKKGEEKLTETELVRLRNLAEAAEFFEDQHEPLPLPSTLPDIIKARMFQLRLNQYITANLLGISEAKFSLIMNGKQKPDVYFIKAIHEKLQVDAGTLLSAIK